MENNGSKKYSFFLKGSKTAVLLVHGITGTPSEMRYVGKRLNKAGYSVLCDTLPRHCHTLSELKKVTWQEIVALCLEDFKALQKDHAQVFVAGLSMGALVGIHLSYLLPGQICGLIGLAPTISYDGWAIHKGQALLPLVWHIPFLRNAINIKEDWPYGLKDEVLREHIHRAYTKPQAGHSANDSVLFGSPFFPIACLYQHTLFARVVKKELSSVRTPILLLHAHEDDMTSSKNSRYILDHIGSADKSLVLLQDSYHMITIDKERDKVVEAMISFLNRLSS